MPPATSASRGGFTLIEILVALLIGGGAVLLAASIVSVSANLTESVQHEVATADARHGSERIFRRLVGQLTWSVPGDPAVGGETHELLIMTWCDTAHGWQERCAARFDLMSDDGSLGVLATFAAGDTLRLFPADTVLALLYLTSAAHGGTWSAKWNDPTTFPVAIGLVIGRDTLVARTGERG